MLYLFKSLVNYIEVVVFLFKSLSFPWGLARGLGACVKWALLELPRANVRPREPMGRRHVPGITWLGALYKWRRRGTSSFFAGASEQSKRRGIVWRKIENQSCVRSCPRCRPQEPPSPEIA